MFTGEFEVISSVPFWTDVPVFTIHLLASVRLVRPTASMNSRVSTE